MTDPHHDEVPLEIKSVRRFGRSTHAGRWRELPSFAIEEVLGFVNSSRQRKTSSDRRKDLFDAITKIRDALVQHHELRVSQGESAAEMAQILDEFDTQVASSNLEAFFDNMLDHPSHRLAVYGTLKPGGSNAAQLSGIEGDWLEGTVHGIVEQPGEYLEFTWDTLAPPISVMVFSAPRLSEHFDRLDDFEGPDYLRILVPVEIDGMIEVCNIYEGKRRKKHHA